MENGNPSENKELIQISSEEMGSDKSELLSKVEGESTSESSSSNDHIREDQTMLSKIDSLRNDLWKEDQEEKKELTRISSEEMRSDSSNIPSEAQEEKKELTRTEETTICNSNLQSEVQGESTSEMQPLSSNDPKKDAQEVPVEMDSLESDLRKKDQEEMHIGMQFSNCNKLQKEIQGEVASGKQFPKDDVQEDLSRELPSPDISIQSEHPREVPNRVQSPSNSDIPREDQGEMPHQSQSLNNEENSNLQHAEAGESLVDLTIGIRELERENPEEKVRSLEEIINEEKEAEPIFDGTEDHDMEATAQGNAWPEKAVAIKNFVREKSVVAVSSVIRRLSGKKDEDGQIDPEAEEKNDSAQSNLKVEQDLNSDIPKESSPRTMERSTWNPLSFIKIGRDLDTDSNSQQRDVLYTDNTFQPLPIKGRIILYTRLGCQDCMESRLYLYHRRLRYVEINIDVYPSRKLELEKFTGSSAVPVVFFNEIPIGGLSVLKEMDESGELKEKINDLISIEPSLKAPVPPLSGEDDESCSGMMDELALIVRKMRDSILVKDRFHRMRRFSNSFVGSEAVDFLSEDQYLERKEAIEFGRKLARKHFFKHVLEENDFEDGNHLYRFLDHDPIISSQCYNIPRGTIDVKPKPIIDIASRLRFLSLAMFEAYTSIDGKHVDYRSIHGSEEFARYLRVVEELQRVEMKEMSREEKLAFFINLYNMMAIHAILMWGYPAGPLERRTMLGDFKYVIGGYTYSLSAIENGILRCNQRPPYNLLKPFGVRDPRTKVALPYPEPLIHFALVNGTRSGPVLRCFSPSNIDKELMEAARNFLRNGGITLDTETKVASVSRILRWYSSDFGKNEVEVLKHAANYLETAKSEEFLELLATTQLKVVYLPYDWGVNC